MPIDIRKLTPTLAEDYVNDEFIAEDHDFRGPIVLFEQCGFEPCGKRGQRVTMRKPLNQPN